MSVRNLTRCLRVNLQFNEAAFAYEIVQKWQCRCYQRQVQVIPKLK